MPNESQRTEEPTGSKDTPITVGPITVDVSHLQVSVDGKTRSLTAVEGHILNFLAIHANTVCTSDQIGSSIWGTRDNSLIKVYIHRLRHKIEPDPMHPTYLLTIPEEGYMLVSNDQDETKE